MAPGTPLQSSCLENPMDGGAWRVAVHGVTESRTRLSDFTLTFHFHALKKEMATPSSVLTWRIPGTGEPGGLPSVGSHRVGHDWSDLAAAVAAAGYSRSDGIPAQLFQILEDDGINVLHAICQQIWKTQRWPQNWNRSVFISIPKKGNAKKLLKLPHSWTHFTC